MNFSIKEAGIFLLVFLWPFVGGFSLVRWKASKPLSSTLSSVDDIASYWGVIVVSLQLQQEVMTWEIEMKNMSM
jgi:hypothetical protein